MDLKKYFYLLGFAIILPTLIFSCKKSSKEIEYTYLTSAIEKLKVDDHTKWIVVLPGLGCHGCIQEGEAFMRDNVTNKDILFILTNISSLKILQQKIGIQIKDYSNVYVDRENIFSIPTDNKWYPCIIRIENAKIADHQFQSPSNNAAFMNFKKAIRN